MDDSLLLAKLTLMLLRASAPHPDSLPSGYGIVIPPAADVLSEDEALAKLAQLGGGFELQAEVQGRNLVIFGHRRTPAEETKIKVVAESFSEGIRRLSKDRGMRARIKAVGFQESLVVPPEIMERWFWVRGCSDCSVGIGPPTPEDSLDVAAVVHLGY